MKNLDEILADPRTHGIEIPNSQVDAWSEHALQRWNLEQARTTAVKTVRPRLEALLFWGSCAAACVLLGSSLWDQMDFPLVELRALQSDFFTQASGGLNEQPYWIAGIAAGFAILFTRPLRELFLD